MKQPVFILPFLVTQVLALCGSWVHGAEPVSAKTFADQNGILDEPRAALYIVYRDNVPLAKVMSPNQVSLDMTKVVDSMGNKLDDLISKTHHEAPWTWQELDKKYPPKETNDQVDNTFEAWKRIPGVTKEERVTHIDLVAKKTNTIAELGPFKLRKNADELTKSTEDAKGATLTYSHNALKAGSGAINSEGVLDYPVGLPYLYQSTNHSGTSLQAKLDLASEWKVAQIQEDSKKDIEELTFSTPATFYFSPGAWGAKSSVDPDTVSSRLVLLQAKPYFQTDFGFRHEIYGAQASLEYVGDILRRPFFGIGGFNDTGIQGLQYQLRLIPQMDYSVTERGGIHSTRKEGDDWFRLGGTGSLDFRLGLKTFNALDAGVAYQFLQTVSGSGGYAYLFKSHFTLWLIQNVGATIEYSKGETPVADKPIDLLSFGLEFKY